MGSVVAVVLIGIIIYMLTIQPDNPYIWLMLLLPLSLAGHVYHHQASALRFKTIITESDKTTNHDNARSALTELGWMVIFDDGDYMEALVPFWKRIWIYSQLVVIMSTDRKIMITSISQPDLPPVQGGLSFGQHKRNIARFAEMLRAFESQKLQAMV